MNPERLRENVESVKSRIAAACRRTGRDPGGVTLVAVTKTVGADVVRALAGMGVCEIGENRVQEAAGKQQELRGLNLRWHMIGHLQTNKAGEAVRMFDLIHSLDSVRLAEALARRAELEGKTVPALVQVNVSGEDTKSGVAEADAAAEVKRIAQLSSMRIKGLMTMAPLVDDPEKVRPLFSRLRELAREIDSLAIRGVEMAHLSMGMTQDFEVAVEEGATLVRVGTALFTGA